MATDKDTRVQAKYEVETARLGIFTVLTCSEAWKATKIATPPARAKFIGWERVDV